MEALTHGQWFAGGVVRSVHRYASDALVVTMVIHLVRYWAFDRLRGFRAFSWITGVVLLWLVFAAGANGYMLPWDRLAQFVTQASFEWLDSLPGLGGTDADLRVGGLQTLVVQEGDLHRRIGANRLAVHDGANPFRRGTGLAGTLYPHRLLGRGLRNRGRDRRKAGIPGAVGQHLVGRGAACGSKGQHHYAEHANVPFHVPPPDPVLRQGFGSTGLRCS